MKSSQKLDQIISIVSSLTKVSVSDILSPSRKANIVLARHLSMSFCRYKTESNTLAIAKFHKRDNHATVLHACNSIHSDLKRNKSLRDLYQRIEEELKNA